MSGGSMNYICYTLEECAVGHMYDIELNELMQDVVKLLHDCEWWQSGDIGEDTYRHTVKLFKNKWLQGGRCRNERLKTIIDQEIEKVRVECYRMIGAEES